MMPFPLSINNPLSPRTKRIHYLPIWHVVCLVQTLMYQDLTCYVQRLPVLFRLFQQVHCYILGLSYVQ